MLIAQKKARVDWWKEILKKYDRGDESWIYAYESESKQQSTVWVFRRRFSTREEALDAFRMHFLEIRQSEWQKCFDNWYKRI